MFYELRDSGLDASKKEKKKPKSNCNMPLHSILQFVPPLKRKANNSCLEIRNNYEQIVVTLLSNDMYYRNHNLK